MTIKLAALALLTLLLNGCMTNSASRLINAAAKDPATAHISVKTVYGTLEYDRTNPNQSTLPHSIKDGEIKVGPSELQNAFEAGRRSARQ